MSASSDVKSDAISDKIKKKLCVVTELVACSYPVPAYTNKTQKPHMQPFLKQLLRGSLYCTPFTCKNYALLH